MHQCTRIKNIEQEERARVYIDGIGIIEEGRRETGDTSTLAWVYITYLLQYWGPYLIHFNSTDSSHTGFEQFLTGFTRKQTMGRLQPSISLWWIYAMNLPRGNRDGSRPDILQKWRLRQKSGMTTSKYHKLFYMLNLQKLLYHYHDIKCSEKI